MPHIVKPKGPRLPGRQIIFQAELEALARMVEWKKNKQTKTKGNKNPEDKSERLGKDL